MNRAVFFDRDGVLNQAIIRNGKPYAPRTIEDLVINPDAYGVLGKLKENGFLLIGVTNQPDVARGQALKDDVELIHQQLREELPLDDIRVCYHDDSDNCTCRKPKPGLLEKAAHDLSISLADSFMIGDRWKDIDAGKAANCLSIWLINDYAERRPENMDYSAINLLDAAAWIMGV